MLSARLTPHLASRRDRETGECKGYAFVSFESRDDAARAKDKVDGKGCVACSSSMPSSARCVLLADPGHTRHAATPTSSSPSTGPSRAASVRAVPERCLALCVCLSLSPSRPFLSSRLVPCMLALFTMKMQACCSTARRAKLKRGAASRAARPLLLPCGHAHQAWRVHLPRRRDQSARTRRQHRPLLRERARLHRPDPGGSTHTKSSPLEYKPTVGAGMV
jgi:hypothetical protein